MWAVGRILVLTSELEVTKRLLEKNSLHCDYLSFTERIPRYLELLKLSLVQGHTH